MASANPYASAYTTPSASRAGSISHGGAEQETRRDVFGRPFTGVPDFEEASRSQRRFRLPRTAPTSPRVRSPDDDDRSRERRTPPRAAAQPSEPVGMSFRLAASEQTVRSHQLELVSHKNQIDAMRSVMESFQTDKKTLEDRRDKTFIDWKARIAGMDEKNQKNMG